MAARRYDRIWQLALRGPALGVDGFFIATLFLPRDTMGDPAFDIPLLRARWYVGFGIVWLHLALVAALIWQMARAPGWAAAAGLALSASTLTLIWVEEGQLIRHGALILSHEASLFRLNVNRFMTAALSLAALVAVWRCDARP